MTQTQLKTLLSDDHTYKKGMEAVCEIFTARFRYVAVNDLRRKWMDVMDQLDVE